MDTLKPSAVHAGPPMRVVLAAAASQLAANVRLALDAAGHTVHRIGIGDVAGLGRSTALGDIDLLILQPGAARQPAWDALAAARRRGMTMPVLVVDQQFDVAERVRALDAGADDCMSAPLASSELDARVRALRRRCERAAVALRHHGPLTLDKAGHKVYLADGSLLLTQQELRVLEMLMEQAGRLVTLSQFARGLCDNPDAISANAIQVYVHRLRKKMGGQAVRIATLPGQGYRLETVPA